MKHLIFFLLALFMPAGAEAAIRYISPTGNDSTNSCSASTSSSTPKQNFHGANGAVACMAAGDTLVLMGGTYPKGIDRDSTIPNGVAGAPTIFQVRSGDTVTIQPTSFGAIEILNGAGRSYITFDGGINCGTNATAVCAFILDGVSSGSPVTVGSGNSNIVVTNFEAKNAAPVGSEPSNGIQASGTNNAFSNCNVHHHGLVAGASGSGGYGMYNGSGSGMIADGCLFHDNGGYGVHVYGTPSAATIKNSIFYQNNQVATIVSGELILGSGSNHKVYNNVIRDGLRGGIYVFNGCSGCLIYNNTVARNAHWGIQLTASIAGATVRNNIFYNNNASGVGSGNIEDYGSNTKSENLCFGSGGSNACTLTVDPLFVNAATNDFHLAAGSPAIDAGTATIASGVTIPACTVSILTNCYYGARPDIGAFDYSVPLQVVTNQMVLALPLDEGSGSIAVDVSGQKNNATLVGGATWDNAGIQGKAIMLDGTGYLNIPAAKSLALAPAMTLEVWVYPTVSPSGFSALIVQDRYYLYSASDPGVCPSPSLAPLGGYSTTVGRYLCATAAPSVNQWSHLAVTHDGLTTTFYLNGNVIASQTSTDPMVPTSFPMTIGASQFGEYFTGKVDQLQVFNYARTRPQILSDMSTPLIGAPGKYVEIAAPVSVEISAAASIEISAD